MTCFATAGRPLSSRLPDGNPTHGRGTVAITRKVMATSSSMSDGPKVDPRADRLLPSPQNRRRGQSIAMIIEGFPVGPVGANCYIFGDDATREVFVIDP